MLHRAVQRAVEADKETNNKDAELLKFDETEILGTHMLGEVIEVESIITPWLTKQLDL